MSNNLLDVKIRITPSDKDHVCLIAEDVATGACLSIRVVSRKDLISEREQFASEILNRSDVRSIESPTIPMWAKEVK